MTDQSLDHVTQRDSTDIDELEMQFEHRNERLREVIDILASYDAADLAAHGRKKEITEKHNLDYSRVTYVLERWDYLVDWRRRANANPLDPEAVRNAYEDETMAEMADGGVPMSDGAGNVTVNIELGLDQVFRAIKLLPGDLGLTFYAQTLEQDLPREGIQRILQARDDAQ